MRSTFPSAREKFGRELRRLREQAGYSQGKLASEVPLSQGMVSAIELGRRATSEEYIGRFDEVLTTGGKLFRLWKTLTAGAGLAEWAQNFVRLQQEASEIRQYQLSLVPGLLQEREYAWTTLRACQRTDSDDAIKEQVETRMERQAILTGERRVLYTVVLDEAVLRRPIGGREIMTRQLDVLLKASHRSNVAIQIVPMATEHHPCLSDSFQVITVPGRGEILYLETEISGTPVDDPEDINYYTRLFSELRGLALTPAASRDRLEAIRGEFQ